jgi:hypothetical protein
VKDLFQQLQLAIGWTLLRVFEKPLHLSLPAIVNLSQSHAGERLIEVGRLEISDEQPVFSQEQRVISPSGLTQSIQHVGPHDPMPSLVFVDPVFLNLKLEANALVIVHVKSLLSYFLEGTWAETCATISILRHNIHPAPQYPYG